MSELLKRQILFSSLLPKLIDQIYYSGFDLTLGELWRPPETAAIYAAAGKGTKNSCHILKLAIDINLFWGGEYVDNSLAHKPFGDFWKTLNPLCRWGGDFSNRKDGNHYSIESPEGWQ